MHHLRIVLASPPNSLMLELQVAPWLSQTDPFFLVRAWPKRERRC